MISLIAAMDRNRNIGLNGDMPWGNTMKADLKRFKELTDGKAIVMGRKTFESLPNGPLPNRVNTILSRNASLACDIRGKKMLELDSKYSHTMVISDIEELLTLIRISEMKEVFVIGGAQIYEQFMPYVDRIYLTKIHNYFQGDTKFPAMVGNWSVSHREVVPSDENNPYSHTFTIYDRVRS